MRSLIVFLGMVLVFPPLAGATERIRDPENGCATSNPYPRPDESIQWSGRCLNGLLHGKGVLIWMRNGIAIERDEGVFRNGELEGPARILFADGSTIWGNYRQGVRDGEFLIQRPDGAYIRAIYDRGALLREESLTREQVRDLRNRRARGQKLRKVAEVKKPGGAKLSPAPAKTARGRISPPPPLSVTAPQATKTPTIAEKAPAARTLPSSPLLSPALRSAPAQAVTPFTPAAMVPEMPGAIPAISTLRPMQSLMQARSLPPMAAAPRPAIITLRPPSAPAADGNGLIPYPYGGGGLTASAPVLHLPAATPPTASPRKIVLRPPSAVITPPAVTPPPEAPPAGKRYTINLRNTPATDAIRLMLGDMLKVPYRFEGALQGNLSTSGPQIVGAGEIPGYLAALIAPLGGQLLRERSGYVIRGNIPAGGSAETEGDAAQNARTALLTAYRLEKEGNDKAAIAAYRRVSSQWPASTAAIQARQRLDALKTRMSMPATDTQSRRPPSAPAAGALLGRRVCSAPDLYGAKARWCGTVLQVADGHYKVEVDNVSPGNLLALGFEADTCTGGVFLSRFGIPVTIWVPRACLSGV